MAIDYYTPISLNRIDDSLQREILSACNVDVELCLECGKCSGGCPNGHVFDYTPRKIVQLVKLGEEKTLMTMDALWICLSCHLCLDRCPSGIDIPRILDYIREKACQTGAKVSRPRVRLFYDLVLKSVSKRGHVSEMFVALRYNWETRQYMKDARLGIKMLLKGKLTPFGKRMKKKEEVRKLFEKSVIARDLDK